MSYVAYDRISKSNRDLVCPARGRILTDEELIVAFLGREASRPQLPQPYRFSSPDDYLKQHPDCCEVVRRPFGQPGWIERNLFSEVSQVRGRIEPNQDADMPALLVTELTGPCGLGGDDRSAIAEPSAP